MNSFTELNNLALSRFAPEEQSGDHDLAHSADVDYAELLPRQKIRMRVIGTALAAAVLGGRHAG